MFTREQMVPENEEVGTENQAIFKVMYPIEVGDVSAIVNSFTYAGRDPGYDQAPHGVVPCPGRTYKACIDSLSSENGLFIKSIVAMVNWGRDERIQGRCYSREQHLYWWIEFTAAEITYPADTVFYGAPSTVTPFEVLP